jgi:RNA polymerase sigma factor (sigma-70 family)
MEKDEFQTARTSLVLFEQYREGDDTAADALFSRYFERLTSLARGRLSPRLARRTDPEDIVLSVYRSFFIDARAGRFTLTRGGDLWRLLASITKHKILRHVRHHGADRRSVDLEMPLEWAEEGCDLVRGHEPTPEEALSLSDELEWVLSRLDRFSRRVMELRMQGAKLSEIAEDTGRSERSVRRALGQLRAILARRLDDA